MIVAIIFALLLFASVIFHFVSPWQISPLGSNWGTIDDTLSFTFLVTGIFFIAIVAFMIFCIFKYQAKPGRKSEYQREDKKLEGRLIWITTAGICLLLAPGLIVYSDFVHVPDDAVEFEAMGEQWTWSFRLPGEDQMFGRTSINLMDDINNFGIDPEDPNGQDDIIVMGNKMHLLLDQPIKVNLRSKDVLHDFYVPEFRGKMDLIPGQITYFWFTPTVEGTFDLACAEYCGVGHYNMRGQMVVEGEQEYGDWLASQKTFAQVLAGGEGEGLVEQGERLALNRGCMACHSIDGSPALGPGWKDMYGRYEKLTDGSEVLADEAYLIESIVEPNAKMVEGYPPVMVAYDFSEEQLDALLAYMVSLSSNEIAN